MVSRFTINQPRQHSADTWHHTLREWFTYGTIGGSTTVLDFGLFNLLLWTLGPTQSWSIILLSCVTALLSSVNSYFGHRRWTFKQSDAPFGSFLALNVMTLALNTLLVLGLSVALPQVVELSVENIANLSKAFAIAGSGLAGFLGNKYWVFRG